MKRWMPLVLVFTALTTIAIWLLVREASDLPGRERATPGVVESSEGESVAPHATVRLDDESNADRQGHVEGEASAEGDEAPAPANETDRVVREAPEELHGRLVVVDAEGVESRSESGTMRVFVQASASGGYSIAHTVEVEEGAWSIPVRGGIDHVRELRVHEIRLGERTALREGDPYDPVEVRPGEPVVVRAQWKDVTLLHVVDAATGVSLDEIEIRLRSARSSSAHEHPGVLHEQVLVASGASPIEVGPGERRASRTIFVGRPGYAWRVVTLAPSGGERTVELERGGALRIRLERDEDTAPLMVRVYRDETELSSGIDSRLNDVQKKLRETPQDELDRVLDELEAVRQAASPQEAVMLDGLEALLRGDGSAAAILGFLEKFDKPKPIGVPVAEVPARGRAVIDLEGMAPGRYVTRIELGNWFGDPAVLASESVQVPSGGRGEVTLSWVALDLPEPATLELTVECPRAWEECSASRVQDARRVTLEFQGNSKTGAERWRRIRADEPKESGGMFVFEFEPVELEPGRYEITVRGIEVVARIRVADEGKTEHVIRLPEPTRVVLSVVEKGTGEPVMEGDVSWRPSDMFGGGGTATSATRIAGSNRFEFCAPMGLLEIEHQGRYRARQKFFTGPSGGEITLEVDPTSVISFTLKHEGTTIPFGSRAEYDVDVLEGSGRLVSYNSSSIRVVSPGHYRIGLPQVTGFEPIPPFEVRVAKGEDIHREFQLVPIR